jgi:hypothetical protein
MVRELVFEIDKEAERKGDYSASGELFVIKKAHAMKIMCSAEALISLQLQHRRLIEATGRESHQGEVS